MNVILKWKEQLIEVDLRKLAYREAYKLHNEYDGCKYGTKSYYLSLSNRISEMVKEGLEKELKEESERPSISSYWSVKNSKGIQFHDAFLKVVKLRLMPELQGALRNSNVNFEKKYVEILQLFLQYLADFKKLGEKKDD